MADVVFLLQDLGKNRLEGTLEVRYLGLTPGKNMLTEAGVGECFPPVGFREPPVGAPPPKPEPVAIESEGKPPLCFLLPLRCFR